MITALEAAPGSFPKTAIVTFDDDANDQHRQPRPGPAARRHRRAHDPQHARLPGGLQRRADDRRAAARHRRAGDPRHRRRQPSDRPDAGGRRRAVRVEGRAAVTCCCPAAARREQNPPAAAARRAPRRRRDARREPDEAQARRRARRRDSIRTFSEESLFTGGAVQLPARGQDRHGATRTTRYSDTLANLGISAVRPAVAAVNPAAVPQGTALDVELTGSQHGLPRREHGRRRRGRACRSPRLRVLSPTRIDVRLTVGAGRRDRVPRRDGHHRPRRRLDRDGEGHRRRAGGRARRPAPTRPVGHAVGGRGRRDARRHDLGRR